MIDIRTPVAAPVETVTPIRPSEAIRLGCLLRPIQCTGDELKGDDEACAWGALRVGLGLGDDAPAPWEKVAALYQREVQCPGDRSGTFHADGKSTNVAWLIKHLNDGYCMDVKTYAANGQRGWSRERIADWLEGLGL